MTTSQRIHLMTLWGKACAVQGWASGDSDRRHALYESVLGKDKRFHEFTESDFSAVKAKLLELGHRVQGAVEVDHPELHHQRQWLWKIRNVQTPLLRFYGHDPESYIRSVIRDKFRAYAGLDDIGSLSFTSESGPPQLLQLVMTLDKRIDGMRRQAKHTVKQMQILAGLAKSAATATPPAEPPGELATAGAECPF